MAKNTLAVLFLLIKDDQILMEERSFSDPKTVHQVFLGGNVEEDEIDNLEKAFLREVNEELGLKPIDYFPIKPLVFKSDKGLPTKTLAPFVVKKWEGEIPKVVLDQGNPLVWLSFKKLEESPLERIRTIAAEVKKHLNL